METMYIQSIATGRISLVAKRDGETMLKSGLFVRVADARAERISAAIAR